MNLTVLPNDIDILKITNDRYLALMDLGRLDLAARNGLTKTAARRKWAPLVTFINIRFRYPLKIFEKYQLRTRIICWDDETFYIQQKLERNHQIIATAYVCATFLGPHGPISPNYVLKELNFDQPSPEKPEIVSKLQEMDSMIHEEQRDIA